MTFFANNHKEYLKKFIDAKKFINEAKKRNKIKLNAFNREKN